MADQNKLKKAFDPTKSKRAVTLMNMSDEKLFRRYFMIDNGVPWINDFNDIKDEEDDKGNDKYPKVYSLSLARRPLDVICTIVHKRLLETYTPNGYKFNSRNFIEDLESILNDNVLQSLNAAGTAKENEFIVQLSNFFVETISRGLIHKQSLLVD